MTERIDTDVLVIGGGAAGAKAAIDASDYGLKVTMVVKGFLGKSGCSIFAGNMIFFGSPTDKSGDSSEEERHQRAIRYRARATHYLGDQQYLIDASKWSVNEYFPWLEERGLLLMRREDGSLLTDLPRRGLVWTVKQGMSGPIIMELLRGEIRKRSVPVLEETVATSLLTRDGEVVGATALDYRRGRFLAIRAKVVILATGHSNYLASRSTATREGTAAGWVMAAKAGAELQNLEIHWYHCSDMAFPRSWMRLHLYPNPLPDTTYRSLLVTADGTPFFDGTKKPDFLAPYYLQVKALIQQVLKGNASFFGGYYTDYRHVEPGVLRDYVVQTQFPRKIGLEPTRDLLPNAITWHQTIGGVRTNGSTMESTLPGLLIAGSVACMVSGGIQNASYDGTVAARTAAGRVTRLPLASPDEEQIAREEQRVFAPLANFGSEGLLPAQIKKQIREAMTRYMYPIKNQKRMEQGLTALERIRKEVVPQMRLQDASLRFNWDWLEALDVDDMLRACELWIRFSLFRRESRGAFFREDFPMIDNENWLAHVIGRMQDGELHLEKRPAHLPYARPEEKMADFFAVDY